MFITFQGHSPQVDPDCWVAPNATVVGRVRLEAGSSIWYGAVVRGDGDSITVGNNSNVQDGCVLHADPRLPLTLGSGVSVGHRAVLHGCTIGDDVLIGMGAVVLNGARIGSGSLIAAGTVVLENTEIPPNSLVAGIPAKVRRTLTDEALTGIRQNASTYVALSAAHREASIDQPSGS